MIRKQKLCPILSATQDWEKLIQVVVRAARGQVIAGHGPQGSDRANYQLSQLGTAQSFLRTIQ